MRSFDDQSSLSGSFRDTPTRFHRRVVGPQCATTINVADERDQVLGNIADEVLVILNSRPGLIRRWLLGLDRVNRRFAVSSAPHRR